MWLCVLIINQGNTIKSMGFKTINGIFWLLPRLVCTYKKGLQEGQFPPPWWKRRQVWAVSMLNVADLAHLRPWMQAWVLHVCPSRLHGLFLDGLISYLQSMMMGQGGLSTTFERHGIYGAGFICMKFKESKNKMQENHLNRATVLLFWVPFLPAHPNIFNPKIGHYCWWKKSCTS